MHVRQQMREAVKAALVARDGVSSGYLTTAKDKVFTRAAQPLNDGDLPYIRISTFNQGEQAERLNHEADIDRTIYLDVILDTYQKTDNIEDELDDFCVEVEKVINSGVPGALDLEYRGTDFDFPQEGKQEFGRAIIHYEIKIVTSESDPEESIKA